jgi:hypothetical protein
MWICLYKRDQNSRDIVVSRASQRPVINIVDSDLRSAFVVGLDKWLTVGRLSNLDILNHGTIAIVMKMANRSPYKRSGGRHPENTRFNTQNEVGLYRGPQNC